MRGFVGVASNPPGLVHTEPSAWRQTRALRTAKRSVWRQTGQIGSFVEP